MCMSESPYPASTDFGDSATNFVDRQDQYYQRPMPPRSYQTPGFYSNTRPTPPPFPSTQSPELERRNSHSPALSKKQQPHQNSLSPALHFHQPPSNHTQSSPSLPSIFPLQNATDLPQKQPNTSDNTHLTLPGAFSPSAFGLSPPAFLTDPSLNISPTPPSNTQYATFPFDTANTTQSHPGGTDLTPGAQSQTSGSHTAGSETGNLEKDPFLSLLEQLAENEHSQGGPSELDFFLAGAVDQEGDLATGEEKVGAGEEM